MSSTRDESAADDEVTPSQSQLPPESTGAISTVNALGEPINQVFFHLHVPLLMLFSFSRKIIMIFFCRSGHRRYLCL